MNRKETLGYRFRLIHNEIHKRMEVKRLENGDDLTGMQRWILGFLREHDGEELYQRDIEAAFSVSRATASNMLHTMEQKRLITRVSVAHDARLKKLLLTERARSMTARADRDVREAEALLVKGFTEEERTKLTEYLDRILRNLEKEET